MLLSIKAPFKDVSIVNIEISFLLSSFILYNPRRPQKTVVRLIVMCSGFISYLSKKIPMFNNDMLIHEYE